MATASLDPEMQGAGPRRDNIGCGTQAVKHPPPGGGGLGLLFRTPLLPPHQHTKFNPGHETAVDQQPRPQGLRGSAAPSRGSPRLPPGSLGDGGAPSTHLMRSTVSEYTVNADFAELSDSMAIPHSIKARTASKYLKAFPALSACGRRAQAT